MTSPDFPKIYDPHAVEAELYRRSEVSGFFNPDNLPGRRKKSFTIVMPPPNVTGTLHLGHAVMLAVEDLMIRFKRMRGFKALWLPGTDHAAIATQAKVEREVLLPKGQTRQELGREKFLQEVEKYVRQSKDTIHKQIRAMGASCDWSREAYTLDTKRSRAVRTTFKMMHDDGLIYRGYRIVNWCPRCQSTLADDEVSYKETTGKFYYFKYGPVVIGTARPETKFLDKTIVVHPDDPRYRSLHGKEFEVEWIEGTVKANVITDKTVDKDFGTGAMTITPAHDFHDYELAQKFKLSVVQIIDEQGNFTSAAGDLAGKNARAARDEIVRRLQAKGLVDRIEENYVHNLSICYRCDTPIEPLPKLQWFIDVAKPARGKKSLKDLMREAVASGKIKIIPENFNKTYFHWIDNLRDWNISRQIWFGHQVPVWYRPFLSSRAQPRDIVYVDFFRHGESTANAENTFVGHLDVPLTDKGREKAKVIGKKVSAKDYAAIFSSDLVRAKETAEIIFGSKSKIIIDTRLREINAGIFQGKAIDQEFTAHRVVGFPGGETYGQVASRVGEFLASVKIRYPGQRIAIVAHSGVWKVLEHIIHNRPLDESLLSDHAPPGPVPYEIASVALLPRNGLKNATMAREATQSQEMYVGVEPPTGDGWKQDPDTLDTWFSAGLWTFSTLGWPEKTKDLKTHHPTDVLETGYDILFFWIARMILMTTYALGEIPFKTVYLHGLVRDEQGRKMSKSFGNIIDPLDVAKKYGTDAVRLSLVLGMTPGQDTRLSEEKIAGFRNFTNKLWNIARFVAGISNIKFQISNKSPRPKTLADKWILARLDTVVRSVTTKLDRYEFSSAGEELRDFTWGDFADWYVEIAKYQISNLKYQMTTSQILLHVLQTLLKLWHPFMPFVTEEIWGRMFAREENDFLMVAGWPKIVKHESSASKRAIRDMRSLNETIVALRGFRARYKIAPSIKINVLMVVGKQKKLFEEYAYLICGLARVDKFEIVAHGVKSKDQARVVVGGNEFFITLEGIVDTEAERAHREKEAAGLREYISALESRLQSHEFTSKAPAHVVQAERARLAEAKEKLAKLIG